MPDEPIEAPQHPTAPTPPETYVAMLQGGPMHGRIIRVQADHDDIVLDQGGKLPPAAYRRRLDADSPAGIPFDFVAPPKAVKPVA
jgi:hypothetical protein